MKQSQFHSTGRRNMSLFKQQAVAKDSTGLQCQTSLEFATAIMQKTRARCKFKAGCSSPLSLGLSLTSIKDKILQHAAWHCTLGSSMQITPS